MLEVRNVNHAFANVQALDNVAFSVERGEVLGFLGPNGAGKSTTMRIITGYLFPSSGSVLFDGEEIGKNPVKVREKLGYLPETAPLYGELTVREYLEWVARVKKSADPVAQTRDVMAKCGLDAVAGKLIDHLSKGYKQRVGLAQAILGKPELIILDEPTVGLDPGQIREIRELIKELGRERTVLLSTHILPEVELTCDRVVIINNGRIVAQGKPEDLAAGAAASKFFLWLDLPGERADDVLEAYTNAHGVKAADILEREKSGVRLAIETRADDGDPRPGLTRFAAANDWPVLEFRPLAPGLEDAFVSLVRDERLAPGASPENHENSSPDR